MKLSKPKLRTVVQTLGHTQLLKSGAVAPQTVELVFEEVPIIIDAFRRMIRLREFDVSEMALTTYLSAKAHGKQITALPIFLVRAFHHGAILVNNERAIQSPKDLEGQRVGVNRGYTVTTGVWARSVLQHEYGVDLDKITWVLSGDEHVAEFQPPLNVVHTKAGETLPDLLAAGQIAAAIGISPDSPSVRPLIAEPEAAGMQALRSTGYYPINHTLVVKSELLEKYPPLSADLFEIFSKAKQRYVESLRIGAVATPSKTDRFYKRIMDITGTDPLPFGIEPNRKMLEAIIRYSIEQKIIAQPFSVEELFASPLGPIRSDQS